MMADHIHRWRFDEPKGPEASGRCVRCGAVRLAANAFVDDRDSSWQRRHQRSANRTSRNPKEERQ